MLYITFPWLILYTEACISWPPLPNLPNPNPLPSDNYQSALYESGFCFVLFCVLDFTYKWKHEVFVFELFHLA